MKVFVCLALLAFTLVSAKQVGPKQQLSMGKQRGFFSSAIRSWSNTLGIYSTEIEFLNVCQPQVYNDIEKEVQQTLADSKDILTLFEQAMEEDDKEDLMDIMRKVKDTLSKQIAAIQGTIFAAIESKTSRYRSNLRPCVSRTLPELQLLIKQLSKIEEQTKEAASELKQQTQIREFEQMADKLVPLMNQVEQFVKDPSQKDQLDGPCKSASLPTLMEKIVDTLGEIRPRLEKRDEGSKVAAVEAAAGLLTEANILNAICHAGQYVNEEDIVQQKVWRQDFKKAQNLYKDLESTSKDILGLSGWFSSILGY